MIPHVGQIVKVIGTGERMRIKSRARMLTSGDTTPQQWWAEVPDDEGCFEGPLDLTAVYEDEIEAEIHRETTWITQARAKQIYDARGPFGDFTGTCTAYENAEIHRVWKTLPGSQSWADALLSISRGHHPTTEKEGSKT